MKPLIRHPAGVLVPVLAMGAGAMAWALPPGFVYVDDLI
jgi:hypothetical protein